jgi:hypothetical protein
MADLKFSYSEVKSKINAAKTYNQIKKDIRKLSDKKGDNEEENTKNNTRPLSESKKNKNRSQRNQKTQIDELIDISSASQRKPRNTIEYLKKVFSKTIANCKPKISEILNTEAVNAIGCSQDQTYQPNQVLYIKVRSIDLFGMLKLNPNTDENKILYEKYGINVGSVPFAMNKELYDRLQQPNVSFSTQYGVFYQGASKQDLFDIEYTTTDGSGNFGDFYKITLKPRQGVNNIQEAIKDYYASLDILDFNNVVARLMDILTGFLQIQIGSGDLQISDMKKFEIILQRMLGLCFDENKEIDVMGASKTSELDNFDDSFFQFTSIDLTEIQETISNIHEGVIKFVDCDNIILPVVPSNVTEAINQFVFVPDQTVEETINNAISAVVPQNNEDGFGIKINFDKNLLKTIPKALLYALWSPKIILPIAIFLKALGNSVFDIIDSLMSFVQKMATLVSNIISQIGAIFVEELFKIIKADIQSLIQALILDVTSEKNETRTRVILRLIELLLTVARLVKDYRQCKSVVDELLALLKIVGGFFGNTIPKPLLIATKLLGGFSASRAFVNVIEEYQKLGLPTGPMPDGSANLGLISVFGQLKGTKKEDDENGKVESLSDFGVWLPNGQVLPLTVTGKKL